MPELRKGQKWAFVFKQLLQRVTIIMEIFKLYLHEMTKFLETFFSFVSHVEYQK